MENMIQTLLVAYDLKSGVLVVGEKDKGQSVNPINAFQGEEARELYQKLVLKRGSFVKKEEGDEKDN